MKTSSRAITNYLKGVAINAAGEKLWRVRKPPKAINPLAGFRDGALGRKGDQNPRFQGQSKLISLIRKTN